MGLNVGGVERRDDRLRRPASLADDEEPGRARTQTPDQPPPDARQQKVILARLDRAADDKERHGRPRPWHRSSEKRGGYRWCGPKDRQVGPTLRGEHLPEFAFHDRTRDQSRRAASGKELKSPSMPFRFARPEQAGTADRQDIVDEQDGPYILTPIEPPYVAAPFDRKMGGIQIDGVAWRAARRIVSPHQPMPGETGEDGPGSLARLRPESERRGGFSAVQCPNDCIENAVVLRGRFLAVCGFAPRGADLADRVDAPPPDAWAIEAEQQRPGRCTVEKMPGEKIVDPVDAVRRPVQDARGEPGEIVDDCALGQDGLKSG